uniref:Uncharacterized protein n=1 Tax=Ananas comosus var. bracteatus TaxID=296719 RepID=A0A6V7NJN5_ANACO|nr:unnamed protein product [Ananas comosus var. bracteatus]
MNGVSDSSAFSQPLTQWPHWEGLFVEVTSHLRGVSTLLSRFRAKLSELRFFLRHPSPLCPEQAHINCLWCPFCALDLSELASAFAWYSPLLDAPRSRAL